MVRIIQKLIGLFLLHSFIQTTYSQDVVTNDAIVSNLYITVNARASQLFLTWRNFNDRDGYIVLSQDYPIQRFQRSGGWRKGWKYTYGQREKWAIYEVKTKESSGWRWTEVIFDRKVLNNVGFTTSCYGYYGYYVNSNGQVQSVHCMKLHPTWMNDRREHLGKIRLRELFIPGTHDSSSYKTDLSRDDWDNVVYKNSITQDDSIRDQLLQGVRYIDLRPAYYPKEKPPFYANHGIIKFHQLKDILDQVRDYALKTKEIIILDAHEFPVGFEKNETHDQLASFLYDSLWNVKADPALTWSATLEDIWAGNRTVILSYNNDYVAAKYRNFFWGPIVQRWGNVQKRQDLEDYLFKIHENKDHPSDQRLQVDMAELTATKTGVITGMSPGLREMADSLNPHVSEWYFWHLGPTTNAVAVDFVRGTSIVDAALFWNYRKLPAA